MNPIGGYFGLELTKGPSVYHNTDYSFKSGRSSLHAILKCIKPSLVYVPFYTCNALLTPLEESGTKFRFYAINDQLEPANLPVLKRDEYFIYINYFDVKRSFVYELSKRFANQLIVDNTQAFFMKGNNTSWFFNSCRKFFGVPDGSYLYIPVGERVFKPTEKNEDYFFEHLLKRFNHHVAEGYPYFLKNEIACGSELKNMSALSESLLSYIDYNDVIVNRRQNFKQLHESLKKYNKLDLEIDQDCTPMFYPLWINKDLDRNNLFKNQLFIPTFWQDVMKRKQSKFLFEKSLVTHLLPLPIDHRYQSEDMDFLVNNIIRLL